MNKFFLFFAAALLFLCQCSNSQDRAKKVSLSATEFSVKLTGTTDAQLIDVRTSKEYELGHLKNAKNFDWNGSDFETQIATLDKSKPVFVYCLSGGRSTSAADKLLADGFKKVYEMEGGIMKWRGKNLPEVKSTSEGKLPGMTRVQYDSLLNSDKLVLVDFYADWCGPCRKMKPYLEEIAKEMAGKVIVLRINADENQELCKELKIDALPVLMLYKNKMLTWSNVGYLSKEEIEAEIK